MKDAFIENIINMAKVIGRDIPLQNYLQDIQIVYVEGINKGKTLREEELKELNKVVYKLNHRV